MQTEFKLGEPQWNSILSVEGVFH